MLDIVEYNRTIRLKLEQRWSVGLFEKYVMSEILPPISDYKNAVEIILSRHEEFISSDLLILGSFLIIQWIGSPQNEMLDILNAKYNCLSDRKKPVINYLNALDILHRDRNYKKNETYHQELLKSVSFDIPFVNNRLLMAKFVDRQYASTYFKDALSNIEKVMSDEDINSMTVDDFVNIKNFIKEEIIGTHISYVNYNGLLDDYNKLC